MNPGALPTAERGTVRAAVTLRPDRWAEVRNLLSLGLGDERAKSKAWALPRSSTRAVACRGRGHVALLSAHFADSSLLFLLILSLGWATWGPDPTPAAAGFPDRPTWPWSRVCRRLSVSPGHQDSGRAHLQPGPGPGHLASPHTGLQSARAPGAWSALMVDRPQAQCFRQPHGHSGRPSGNGFGLGWLLWSEQRV